MKASVHLIYKIVNSIKGLGLQTVLIVIRKSKIVNQYA